ncbi:hypothetical protein NEFER03_2232 [Nematocida sp. LUAm3]|nr:hypothetical protein NEFER03_2232 [Nematocida sp. LUAm3]
MKKRNINGITTKIAILAISFILMINLSQATSNSTVNDSINTPPPLLAEDQEAEKSSIECVDTFRKRSTSSEPAEKLRGPFMPQPETKNELLLNTFSSDDLPKYNKRDYQLIFASWDIFKAKCEELADKYNSPEFKDLANYYGPRHIEIDEKTYCIIDLESVFLDILKKYKENYHILTTDNYISIYSIIFSYLEGPVTEEKAAIYFFRFFNSINNYIRSAKYYLDMYYELQSASPSEKYITSTKDLLNLLLAYAIFINPSTIYKSITTSHIWDKVKLSKSERKKLIRYCEFILSHTHQYKNYNLFHYPTTQSRIEEIEKDLLSDNHTLIKNYYSINLLYVILLKNINSANSLKKVFLDNQEHDINFDYDSLEIIHSTHSSSSQLSKITNRIALAYKDMLDSDVYIVIINLVLICGIEGTIEILTSSTDQQNTPKYMQFKKNIEGMILNKDTKVVFNCNEPEKLEELTIRDYYITIKEQRENTNTIVDSTKSKKSSKSYIGFFIFTTISIFALPFLSLVSTTAATLIPFFLLPVIIFIFALYTIYTLSQKENKKRRTSLLRGIPIAAIAFLALYIISTFVITDMNGNPLILKTVQLLLLSEFSLVVLFGLIASGLIIKNVNSIKKRFRARLVLKIVIYALSILLLLLPLIMILIGYKTDAMLLIRSDIIVFSSILFFIGALLEDQNYNEPELQAKRERNRRFTWTAVALFYISFILCITVIYLCSLSKPFDAVTEVTKDSSLFYRFFSSLPMNFYSTSVIPNTP